MNELVSIVLPVFNGGKYLDEAIKSCIEQTYSKIEIITIDDGSTDNTHEVLKNYEDKLLVLSQENKGVSAATNLGIRNMKGKFFKIMNADDVLYPDCVESLVSEYSKFNNKKTIVHGKGETIDENGEFVSEFYQLKTKTLSQFDPNVVLLHHNVIIHCASLFHADAFQYGYYDESLKAAVDYELWLRLCLKFNFKIHLLEQKIVKRRVVKNEGITAQALNETPNYNEETRDLIFNQLDESTRNRYEKELKQYAKKYKIELLKRKPKELVDKLILKMFSPSKAKQISNTYRKFKKNI